VYVPAAAAAQDRNCLVVAVTGPHRHERLAGHQLLLVIAGLLLGDADADERPDQPAGGGPQRAAGGLIGTLVGIGIPEEEARYYEEELVAGQTLVTVRAGYRYDEAVVILHRCGGRDVHTEQAMEPAFPLL